MKSARSAATRTRPEPEPCIPLDRVNTTESQPGTVEPGTLCLGCRYDLGGLDPHANCPECSLPVAESVDWQWLGLEPEGYRRRLASAATVVWSAAAAMLIFILALGLFALVLLFADELHLLPRSVFGWIPLALISAELGLGWWFLSAPSPRTRLSGGRDGLQVFRTIPRLFALASTILATGGILVLMIRFLSEPSSAPPAIAYLSSPAGDVLLSIAFLATLLGALCTHLTGVWYLTRVATRLDARCSQYAPGSLALGLRQTGWIPVYAVAGGVLAVVLYPVAILMVGLFGIVPIAWAVLTVILVPGALLFALLRSAWLIAMFSRAVRSLIPLRGTERSAVHSAMAPETAAR